ncbi:DUF7710 domain-containing protein [Streptosporangium sandarakinum]|uniref:DUF7710 domain-containing protein n=1 Tax=Streptosporangium sandarakinum TaxID=1260955 RepID=UPI00406C060B
MDQGRRVDGDAHGVPPRRGCLYDWAIEHGYFQPRSAHQQTSSFVERFTAAQQEQPSSPRGSSSNDPQGERTCCRFAGAI